MKALKVGAIMNGVVQSVTDFGAFVALKDDDGKANATTFPIIQRWHSCIAFSMNSIHIMPNYGSNVTLAHILSPIIMHACVDA